MENSRSTNSGIYCFHCLLSNKKYIGKSVSISSRIQRHKRNVNNGVTSKLYSAIKKYGWNNFVFGIIEYCPEEQLNSKEIYYIKMYNTFLEGYNMTEGGDGGKTWVMTEEHKQKLKNIMTSYKHSEESKQKISSSNLGRKWSEESKLKFSENCKGRKGPTISDEGKRKISESKKKYWQSKKNA